MPAPIATVVPPAAPPTAPVAKPAVPANGAVKPTVPPTAPGEPAAKPPEGAPTEQKYKLKIEGEIVEMTQAELEKYAQKGKFSDKQTQVAREAIKRAQQAEKEVAAREAARMAKAKDDTDAWMREHGIDPDEFAKKRLEKKVEEGRMTAEQKRALELEAENKRLKAEHESKEKERELERQKQMTAQLQRHTEKQLADAVKRAGLPMGDETFYAVYESFKEAFELGLLPEDGLQPHHADRIIEDAQERLNGAQKSLRENALKLKGEALLNFIGKEAVDNIVAARLEQIRASKGIAPPKQPEQSRPAAPRPNGYLTPAEAEAQLKKLQGRAP